MGCIDTGRAGCDDARGASRDLPGHLSKYWNPENMRRQEHRRRASTLLSIAIAFCAVSCSPDAAAVRDRNVQANSAADLAEPAGAPAAKAATSETAGT
jgi:hypothetical protein